MILSYCNDDRIAIVGNCEDAGIVCVASEIRQCFIDNRRTTNVMGGKASPDYPTHLRVLVTNIALLLSIEQKCRSPRLDLLSLVAQIEGVWRRVGGQR